MKNFILLGVLACFLLTSCQKETVEISKSLENLDVEGRTLGCIEDCNYILADCRGANAQEGESMAEFYEYLTCACYNSVDNIPREECVWMGNNQNDPSSLSCSQIFDLWADWQDLCYVGYTVCINSCGDPHGLDEEEEEEGDTTTPFNPKDCDGDGIWNWNDPTPGC